MSPAAEDWTRMAALVTEYGDFPLGGTDASIVALAERMDTDLVVKFDGGLWDRERTRPSS